MKIDSFVTQIYSSIRYKSKRNWGILPNISKNQLRKWLFDNGLETKWITYIESNYDRNLKPSIDRIDDYGHYEFNNMQLITWRENHIKGVNGLKHNNNSRNQNLTKSVFIWNKQGKLIKECKNYKEAAIYLGCHLVSISRAVTKRRKTIKKHILTNTNYFALTGEDLIPICKCENSSWDRDAGCMVCDDCNKII